MKIELLSHNEIYRVNFNGVDYIVEESTDVTMENFDGCYDIIVQKEDGDEWAENEYADFIEFWNHQVEADKPTNETEVIIDEETGQREITIKRKGN